MPTSNLLTSYAGVPVSYSNPQQYGGYSRGSGMLGTYSPGSAFYTGAGGAVTPGAPARSLDPVFGGIPEVPSLPATQGAAIGGNISNLPGLYNLAGQTNQFNQGQLLGQYAAALPGYADLTSRASGNIAGNLAGMVPQDVKNTLGIAAAERGISTGIGSPNSNAALLRALGLTSLDLQNLGQTQLTEAVRRSPIAQPFDISRFFFSPEDQFRAQQGANIYAAAPQPGMAGRAGLNAAQSGLAAGRNVGGVPTGTTVASQIANRYGQQFGGGGSPASFGDRGSDWLNFFASDARPTGGYNPYTDQSTMAPYGDLFGGGGDQDWSRFFASDEDLSPAGTVTGDVASNYDPYGYYYGG